MSNFSRTFVYVTLIKTIIPEDLESIVSRNETIMIIRRSAGCIVKMLPVVLLACDCRRRQMYCFLVVVVVDPDGGVRSINFCKVIGLSVGN